MADKKPQKKIDDSTVKLYIGGIDPSWSSDRITEILSKHGKINRVDVVKNFAFAFVDSQQTADNIIKELSGTSIDNYRIVIQISKNKQNLPDCDELCFECGEPGHWAKECSQRRKRLAKRGEPLPSGRGGPRSGMRDYLGERGAYDRYPPRDRDPYAREYEARTRAIYGRDPYAHDPYARDPYGRDPYARDPYGRDPYSSVYGAPSRYGYDRYDPTRAYASASYRERSPTSAYAAYRHGAVSPTRSYPASDPYAAARERMAYGRAPPASDPYDIAPLRPDPYDAARRALDTLDSYEAMRRASAYESVPSRSAEQYLSASKERYASDMSAVPKRYPETAYPSRPVAQ